MPAAWGTVSALTSLVTNYSQIVACRFVLGLVCNGQFRTPTFADTPRLKRLFSLVSDHESLFLGAGGLTILGVLFYLSKWYTKKELNLRMSIFYSGSLISGAFGNLIAAGILNGLGNSRGLSPWQWLYIIEVRLVLYQSARD